MLKFVRSEPNHVLNVNSSDELKFLTRIRLGLWHLADHNFKHNFQDYVYPICSCGQEIKTSSQFLLYCSDYYCTRQILFGKVNTTDSATVRQNDQVITRFLLFGNEKTKFLHFSIFFIILSNLITGFAIMC